MAEPIERETGGNSSSICLSVKGREGNPGIPWRTDRLIPYTLLLLLLSLPFIPSALSKHLLLLLLRSPDRISLSEISDSALLSRFLRGEKRKGKKKGHENENELFFARIEKEDHRSSKSRSRSKKKRSTPPHFHPISDDCHEHGEESRGNEKDNERA